MNYIAKKPFNYGKSKIAKGDRVPDEFLHVDLFLKNGWIVAAPPAKKIKAPPGGGKESVAKAGGTPVSIESETEALSPLPDSAYSEKPEILPENVSRETFRDQFEFLTDADFKALVEAGYSDMESLQGVDNYKLRDVEGIGFSKASKILKARDEYFKSTEIEDE